MLPIYLMQAVLDRNWAGNLKALLIKGYKMWSVGWKRIGRKFKTNRSNMSISARCVIKPSLSVVIPAFNEEENLEWVVQDTLSVLDHRFSSSEIIVVNDGSSDQTSFIANRL